MAFGSAALEGAGAASIGRVARFARHVAPRGVDRLGGTLRRFFGSRVTSEEIVRRLAAARGLFHEIDRFVAPSAALGNEFVRLGLPEERIEIRDYGFTPLARVAAPGSSDRLRIGYVGSLVWHKGIHVLIDAVRDLPQTGWTLSIHGDPDVAPTYSAELRERARGLPIHFSGKFQAEAAASIYAELDLLVVPSIWLENSPLVIHEAFQAGVPVIGSRLGGTANLVRDGRWGRLVTPGSARDLGAALHEALENRDLVRAWSSALPGVESIEDDGRKWLETYRELTSARKGEQPDS
jgi:glycosyltransferase involved in cell wall biosynthesis